MLAQQFPGQNQAASHWRLHPALSGDAGCCSFESCLFPGRFIRQRGYDLTVEGPDGNAWYPRECSFRMLLGFGASGKWTFESLVTPDHMLTMGGFVLSVKKNEANSIYFASCTFNAHANVGVHFFDSQQAQQPQVVYVQQQAPPAPMPMAMPAPAGYGAPPPASGAAAAPPAPMPAPAGGEPAAAAPALVSVPLMAFPGGPAIGNVFVPSGAAALVPMAFAAPSPGGK